MPPHDACSQKRSFAHHVQIHLGCVSGASQPARADLEQAIIIVEDKLGRLKIKPVEDDFNEHFHDAFFKVLNDVDMNSSPGECVMKTFGSTNAQVLGYDGESVDFTRVQILYMSVKQRMKELVKEPVADPIKIFIKREPHKRKKIEEERYRLISSVSLIDAMVDRILFTRMQMHQLTQIGESPIMIGWSPTQGGYRLLMNMLQKKPEQKYLMIDKSAWDWTVPSWMIEALFNVLCALAPGAPEWWVQMVQARFHMLFDDPYFVFGDGSKAQQMSPGIMKSGCYLTIYLNSIAQLILHVLIQIRIESEVATVPLCLGDDTIQILKNENDLDRYITEMKSLGFQPKVKTSESVEFAGFKVGVEDYIPEYLQKHLFRLQHLTEDVEIAETSLMSYQLLYAFDEDMLKYIQEICIKRGLYKAILSPLKIRLMATSNFRKMIWAQS